jgi:hypothetical protein
MEATDWRAFLSIPASTFEAPTAMMAANRMTAMATDTGYKELE